jgi:hypothetical protein
MPRTLVDIANETLRNLGMAELSTREDAVVLTFNPYPNPPEATIPSNADTPSRIYCLSDKQSDLFLKTINQRGQYIESIKRHLDPTSLKTAVGVKTLVGISDVWVDEDPTTRDFPHHLISYNSAYQRTWGNSPLYGNVFVVFSKKAWEALPEEKRLTDEQVKELTLQSAP